MIKRIIALIGAVLILMAVIAIPCFADDPEENFVGMEGPETHTIFETWDNSPQEEIGFGGITKREVLEYMYYSVFSIKVQLKETNSYFLKKYSISSGTGVVFWRAMVVFEATDENGQTVYNLIKDGYVYVRCTGETGATEANATSFVWGINSSSNYNESTSVFRQEYIIDGSMWPGDSYGHVEVTKNTLFDTTNYTLQNAYIIPTNGLLTGNVNNDFSVFSKNSWMRYCNGYLMERGYDEGYDGASDIYYDSGYTDGFTAGEQDGYNNGLSTGYMNGYTDGETAGFESGYDEGYDIGHEDGYDTGWNVGYEVADDSGFEYTFKEMIFTIFSAPAYFFNTVLNFEIFGINFGALIKFIISVGLVGSVVAVMFKLFGRFI